MAKTVKKATGARTARHNPPVTLDERDAATAREGEADPSRTSAIESGAQTAKERRDARAEQRDYATEKAEQNRRDLADSDPVGADEEIDQLPITHATLPDKRDVGPPPEANPREGKSSMPIPLAAPAPSQDEQRRRGRNRVLVEATRLGYYDLIRRQAGDRFFINDPADFSKRWMRKAPAGAQPIVSTPNQRIRQQHDDILAMRASGRGGPSAGIETGPEPNPLED